jgi:pimeloyl-ACP methyl ester carboxylesterase
MNYIDVFYPSADGLRLYARDYPGPSAQSPVILCLPGLTRNSKDFAQLADELQHSHRVICPDQRGRGRSARDSDASRYQPDQYARDMIALLDLLNIPEAIIIGTSLGGIMAILMLGAAPVRIKAVVLNDIGPEVDPRGVVRIAGYVGKSVVANNWEEAVQQTALINRAAFPDYVGRDWHAMARELYVQQGNLPVLDYDPLIAQGIAAGTATPNLWPLFDKVGMKPMLVIRGQNSDILSVETLAEMTRRLPHLVSLNIAGRGHAPTLNEPDPRISQWSGVTSATR